MSVNRLNEPEVPTADSKLSDRELLLRFQARNDEAAFAAVLQRHGPMVLRACRRVLDRTEDAEDVFQATFLVLARKAGTVTWRESVGTWLHEAANRLARDVRRRHARRQVREARRPARESSDALTEVSSRELLTILDDEMAGLPEECRAPLLLCCLEGMSGDEAADHLGCSPSTLKRRLRQGRELLQARLARRGIALSVAGLTTLLTGGIAAASVPAELATMTTRAAVLYNAGAPLTPGLVSPAAVSLMRRLVATVSAKVKIAIGLFVLGGLCAIAVVSEKWNAIGGKPANEDVRAPGEAAATAASKPAKPSIPVTVETSLRTNAGQIRQFVFDGDPTTAFASATNPGPADHFTLVFDRAVAVRSVDVRTGGGNGGWALAGGRLEASADGAVFEPLAQFAGGTARGDAGGRKVIAVRVRPVAQQHPLMISEIAIDSEPALGRFRYPIEFAVDTSAAPEMAQWAERTTRVCERFYPAIVDELAADGFRPPTLIPFIVRRDPAALVAASRGRLIVSAGYFDANPHDVGAVVHAASYIVQAYHGRATPDWLVQGVADYIRFFKFEPGAIGPPDPGTARYDGDSKETAAFLAYLVDSYDPTFVRRLNAALREGRYTDDLWVSLTGKSLRELGEEWHRSLRR
ncbi:ECF RNA polymerase sigma factor SigE [Gemmata sp. SH-PL17]|uniref:sigma-70 family RNA polymerase sigma factor n=1 Tax=Gemmata sp. SH-PL17 TaxID=1630693 RepID=UPI0004B3C58D|nr:sigma-70 family RNA polymerase sigma factor [Gemmata sp. SH-PL17]AMV25937.1 ECF RNA polymerase sigma factor SigE [Gemmata sp. SH-PL17]